MSDHPKAAAFEAFVIGALDGSERSAFLEHVSTCDACAATLEREAVAELALMDVHAASKREPKKQNVVTLRPRRTTTTVLGALALAAALFLFLRGRDPKTSPASPMTMTVNAPREATPIPPVTCPDGMGQEKCVEDAHRHGLFVAYPPWASAPPLGGGSGRGPNGPPFGDEQM